MKPLVTNVWDLILFFFTMILVEEYLLSSCVSLVFIVWKEAVDPC